MIRNHIGIVVLNRVHSVLRSPIKCGHPSGHIFYEFILTVQLERMAVTERYS